MATYRLFILPAIIAVFLAACSSKSSSNDEAFKYLNESLESSGITIHKLTETLLMGLKEKLIDPVTANKAQIWYPRAMLVNEYTNSIFKQIDSLKNKLLVITDLNEQLSQEKNLEGEFEKLGKELTFYNGNLMAIDSQISQVFPDPIKLDGEYSLDVRFIPIYLFSRNITVRVALSLLNQIETNVRIIENRMIQFANNKVTSIVESYKSYSTILGISAMRAGPGIKLEITAGVGAFTKSANAKISIDRKLYPLSEDGAVHYEFNAPKAPGKYKKHVKIEFFDEIGKMVVVEKDLDYSVVQ
jgi:hypothetical protein